jgi:hypothetical protein
MQRRLTPADRQALYAYREATIYLEQNGISNFSDRISEMLDQNTTDGLPYVEPPLADEDARQRIWVMIRAGENFPWTGPATLVDCLQANKAKFLVVWPDKKSWSSCMFARRATASEIAAAGLEVTE